MGPEEMSRLAYRGLYWAMHILIVRPGAVFFGILLLGMLIARTGPGDLAENILLGMEDLYRRGPAEEGHLNVKMCADGAEIQAEAGVERVQTPPVPEQCEQYEVTTVSIREAAEEVQEMMVWAYLLALIIGNVTSVLIQPLKFPEWPKGQKAERGRRVGREGDS